MTKGAAPRRKRKAKRRPWVYVATEQVERLAWGGNVFVGDALIQRRPWIARKK